MKSVFDYAWRFAIAVLLMLMGIAMLGLAGAATVRLATDSSASLTIPGQRVLTVIVVLGTICIIGALICVGSIIADMVASRLYALEKGTKQSAKVTNAEAAKAQ